MKKAVLTLLVCLSSFLSFSKSKSENTELNTAIENIIKDVRVGIFLDVAVVKGKRETMNIEDLISLGIEDKLLNVLLNNNIKTLYFPFIESTIENKANIQIVNLDNVSKEADLIDTKTGNSLTQERIIQNFTVMYKTKTHQFDANDDVLHLPAEAEWLPWRRCYCSTGTNILNQAGDVTGHTSSGSCDQYHSSDNRCGKVCSRTGFFSQDCGGGSCPGC